MRDNLPISVKGHLHISDDIGNVIVDKDNAIHPQNMARVISRALSNESNYFIHRIAFGNGGTSVDAALQVTFNTPNDGITPDTQEWRSRLYNETYSEIIDDSNLSFIGTDPGSAGPAVGTRPGGGHVAGDPASVTHVSGPGVRSQELGLISQVTISSVLNPNEPAGQLSSDIDPNPGVDGDPIENTEGTFVFDEIGLYTDGASAADSNGIAQIDLGTARSSTDVAGINAGRWYNINITIGAGAAQDVAFFVPVSTGTGSPQDGSVSDVTYGDICEAINTSNASWGTPNLSGGYISITDDTFGTYPTINAANTFGFLQVDDVSNVGTASTVVIQNNVLGLVDGSSAANAFDFLLTTETGAGIAALLTPVDGADAGVQNAPSDPNSERERLLSHIVFSPVAKTANRTLSITYTLTISVARST